jgi:hypothetical protein
MHQLKPKEALNKAFLKVKPIRNDIELFKVNLKALIDLSKIDESEEHHKNNLSYFLNKTYYDNLYFINTKGRNDLVIHNGDNNKTPVGVIIEAKKPSNKSEMLSLSNINTKALQELLLYFLRERITNKNLDIKNLIATNIQEWFIFDAQVFEKCFTNDKKLIQQFKDFEDKKLTGITTDFFYSDIAKPFIQSCIDNLEFTYFKLEDYSKALYNDDIKDDVKLISLYKLLSPEHLLKLPFANDSNSLDKKFYNELLHIIGLEEVKDGGKKVISRKAEDKRDYGSLIENSIYILEETDKLRSIENVNRFGEKSERAYNVALELCITWINRILFLKLLESQLYAYNKGDEKFKFMNFKTIPNYDELDKLFFSILAKKESERHSRIKDKYTHIPYLNSSLFEPTDLERVIMITNLDNNIKLEIYGDTVLKDDLGKKQKGKKDTLEYLFEFLDSYDFTSEGSEEIQEENKSLINASVLGLIFEKINGYKDGSFFTPGFITMYMCKETIRRAVVQKFNEVNNWNCENYDELYNKIDNINQANQIINSLKICDPAVGSGHFLVSALNEIIAIKHDLKILQDKHGKRLKEYQVSVINDELIVTDEDGELFEYNPRNPESQRIQETLFNEKQTIIENCLFGVDINPNSVKICRLRLWIELLKNAYYKTPSSVTERSRSADDIPTLETLPNIDINIKTGNSLISRFPIDIDIKDALKNNKSWNIESYKFAVSNYRNAKSKDEKRQLEELIKQIKSDFRSDVNQNDPKRTKLKRLMGVLEQLQTQTTMFERSKAEQKQWEKDVKNTSNEISKIEKDIDDIESNQIYHNAFEWRFEFPEVLDDDGTFIGFDVVIGNPPYIRVTDKQEYNYFQANYLSSSNRIDLYGLFYEKSFKLIAKNSYISFITPNTFLTNLQYLKLRGLIAQLNVNYILDYKFQVFEDANVDTISILINNNNIKKATSIYVLKDSNEFKSKLKPYYETKFDYFVNNIDSFNINIHPFKAVLIDKIKNNKVELQTIAKIRNGINPGYPISRQHLLIENPENAINPKKRLDAKDIFKYGYKWKNKWVDYDKNYKVEGGSLRDETLFNKPKILIQDIRNLSLKTRIVACYDEDNLYNLYTLHNIQSINGDFQNKYLLGILNSNLINFYFRLCFKDIHIKPRYLSILPFPKEPNYQQPIIDLVDKILEAKKENPEADTSHWESEIDQLVYKLYDLTDEEIKIVEEG